MTFRPPLSARYILRCREAGMLGYLQRVRMHTSTLPKVLLLDEIKLAQPALAELKRHAQVVVCSSGLLSITDDFCTQPFTSTTRPEFLEDCGTKYKDVTAIYRHFKGTASVRLTGVFDEELVRQLPSSLKYICHNGAGYDQSELTVRSASEADFKSISTLAPAVGFRCRTFRQLSTTRPRIRQCFSYSAYSDDSRQRSLQPKQVPSTRPWHSVTILAARCWAYLVWGG